MSKFVINVDESSCGGCGECVAMCGRGVFAIEDGHSVVKNPNICMGCGHCFAICPAGCITFNGVGANDVAQVGESCLVKYSDLASLMESRRSIRRYKKEKIPQSVLEQIFSDCRYAPTACNTMGNSFTVISDDNTLREISKLTRDALRVLPATAAMADKVQECHIISGAQLLIVGGSNMIANPVDSVIAAEEFELLALTKGIGCCWAGFVTMAVSTYPQLRELLKSKGLDVDRYSFSVMSIGYPDETYVRVPPRPEPKIVWI